MKVELAPRYPQAVQDTVARLMGAYPLERLGISENPALGKHALLDIYEASCEALSLQPETLLARAAELDEHPPDESVAAAERQFFGSLVTNYQSMYPVYQGDPRMTEQQAEERAIGNLRQAYAERTYRLARSEGLSMSDYHALLRDPVFGTSVRMVSLVTFSGHEQMSTLLATPLPIPA